MPENYPILRHWHHELNVFYDNLAILQEKIDEDAIHNLRVAIKKLRSYTRIYSSLMENHNKLLAATKELFSVLGKHRNLEMCKTLLASFGKSSRDELNAALLYFQLLQEQLSSSCRRILHGYENKELQQLTTQLEQDLKSFPAEDISARIKQMITHSLQDVKHQLHDFEDKSHLVRKNLKNVLYWMKLLDETDVLSNTKTIDKILDHLGHIQDHQVLITHLKYYRRNMLVKGSQESQRIKDIEEKAEKKDKNLLQKADKLTHQLVHEL